MSHLDLSLDYLPRLPRNKSAPIGCIGSGFIMADCHLVAYRKAGFNPVAIASRTPEKARGVAERHGLRAYDTYEEMLSSGEVEVVDIAVPPDNQIDVIRTVVKHKKHVRGILVIDTVKKTNASHGPFITFGLIFLVDKSGDSADRDSLIVF